MGRHSVPDPDETPDDPRVSQGHDPEGYAYDEPGSGTGHRESAYAETDYTGADRGGVRPGAADEYDDADYDDDADDYDDDADDADYDDADYEDADYEEPAPGQPGNESDYWRQTTYEEPDAPTRSFATDPPRPPVTGPAHGGEWEGGEWTGQPPGGQCRRRGVSVGVIAALVTVVVVVGAVILWRFFGDALSNRSQRRPPAASGGEVAVAVVADPAIADPLTAARRKYNQSAAPVGDHASRSASSRPTPMRWSTVSSARGPANSVSSPRCGFPAVRCRRRGSRRRPARRPSATAARWSPRRWCWPCGRN